MKEELMKDLGDCLEKLTLKCREDLSYISEVLSGGGFLKRGALEDEYMREESANSNVLGHQGFCFGMLIIARKNPKDIVFISDTGIICGMYIEDGMLQLIPYFGVNKGRILAEVVRILVNHKVKFVIKEDGEPMEGPWVKLISNEEKAGLGITEEVLNWPAIQRYTTAVAKEFLTLFEEEKKKTVKKEKEERLFNYIFENVKGGTA